MGDSEHDSDGTAAAASASGPRSGRGSRGGRLHMKRTRDEREKVHRRRQEREDRRERRRERRRNRELRYAIDGDKHRNGQGHASRRENRKGRDTSRERGMDGAKTKPREATVPLGSDTQRGPARHPHRFFGDDLLRAERYERRMEEERAWSAKLGDLLADDLLGSLGEFAGGKGARSFDDDYAWEEEMAHMQQQQQQQKQYVSSAASTAPQEIPKRWRDAAHGFETKMARGTAGLRELDDEEYAEYIRDGMHRRKNAADIAFEEERWRRWDAEEAKRTKEKEERRSLRREKKRQREDHASTQSLASARELWEAAWQEADSAISRTAEVHPWTCLTFPWPIVLPLGTVGPMNSTEMRLLLTKDAVHHFLLDRVDESESSSTTNPTTEAVHSRRFRAALRRYHPDRFLSSTHFLRITDDGERHAIKDLVYSVAQILSDIVDERRA